jgi:hypothetical protein
VIERGIISENDRVAAVARPTVGQSDLISRRRLGSRIRQIFIEKATISGAAGAATLQNQYATRSKLGEGA